MAVDPGFYMVNWLWLAKCHLALGHKEKAQPWLEKVIQFETSLEEEIEVMLCSSSTFALRMHPKI